MDLKLGGGLGYRPMLHESTLAFREGIDWLEIIADQFIPLTQVRREKLKELRQLFPCVPHCLNMSIGGAAEVDVIYLEQVAEISEILDAPWVSDHFAFTNTNNVDLGHLAPIIWSRETARVVARRAGLVERAVGRPLILENIAYHFSMSDGLSETEFITEVLEMSEVGLLLDVSNIFSNSLNHGFSPFDFIDEIPLDRVVQMHLAGGRWDGEIFEDSHDSAVQKEVWDLAEIVSSASPLRAALVERDGNFPPFEDLLREVDGARSLVANGRLRNP
jgi:hypothetical protein